MSPASPPASHVQATVTHRREVAAGLIAIRLLPVEPIRFVPGQYVTVALPGDAGRLRERPYSLVSAPHEGELELFVELVPGGLLTPSLHALDEGGTVLVRRAAKGRFRLDVQAGRPHHFCCATVTGVAPYVSFVRSLAAGGQAPGSVTVLHAASLPRELGYDGELTALTTRHPWLSYIPTVSRPWLAADWAGERGRIEDVLRKHLDSNGWRAEDTTVYLCGHPQMIRNARGVLERAGWSGAAVREEHYWPG